MKFAVPTRSQQNQAFLAIRPPTLDDHIALGDTLGGTVRASSPVVVSWFIYSVQGCDTTPDDEGAPRARLIGVRPFRRALEEPACTY